MSRSTVSAVQLGQKNCAISPPFAKTKTLEASLQSFWGTFQCMKFSLHLTKWPTAALIPIQSSATINIRFVFAFSVSVLRPETDCSSSLAKQIGMSEEHQAHYPYRKPLLKVSVTGRKAASQPFWALRLDKSSNTTSSRMIFLQRETAQTDINSLFGHRKVTT